MWSGTWGCRGRSVERPVQAGRGHQPGRLCLWRALLPCCLWVHICRCHTKCNTLPGRTPLALLGTSAHLAMWLVITLLLAVCPLLLKLPSRGSRRTSLPPAAARHWSRKITRVPAHLTRSGLPGVHLTCPAPPCAPPPAVCAAVGHSRRRQRPVQPARRLRGVPQRQGPLRDGPLELPVRRGATPVLRRILKGYPRQPWCTE